MPIWMVLWVHLRSAPLLQELKTMVWAEIPSQPAAFRAASRARLRAHPRRYDARSQFSPKGFGGQFRSARALCLWAGQSLAIQDRGGQGRFGQFMVSMLSKITPIALLSSTYVCSGVTVRT